MASSTRSKTAVYLLGSTIETLSGSKLPSKGEVLRLYIHKLHSSRTKHEAAAKVIREVQLFWQKARIPMRRVDHAVVQLEELVGKWETLKKNKFRRTTIQVANEQSFCHTLNDLFDVPHKEAEQRINIDEDLQFLEAQREQGRRGRMSGIDMSLTQKEKRHRLKHKRHLAFSERFQINVYGQDQFVVLANSASSSDVDNNEYSTGPDTATGNKTSPNKKQKIRYSKTNIFSPSVLSSLDRTKTSDGNAVHIIAPVIHAVGEDIKKYSVSRSSVRRSRREHRSSLSSHLNFFHILLNDDFLSTDPEMWLSNNSYLEAESIIRELKVVNDTAERGVALMQEYNSLLTKDEDQMQFALQVVQQHRRKYPDSRKSTFTSELASTSSCRL